MLDNVHVERYFREKVFPGRAYFYTYTPLIAANVYPVGCRYEDGSQVNKAAIINLVMQCRDSHTAEQYNENREQLMRLTVGLLVKPGRVRFEVTFRQYYDTNWESIQPMWVLAYRKKLPLQVS